MVKTKISSRAKAKSTVKIADKALLKTSQTTVGCNQTACNSSCWLCWLFKLMIVLFTVLIVFWLGFCFGDLSSQTMLGVRYRGMSVSSINNFNKGSKMCNGAPINSNLSGLANLTGDEFDKEFLLEMTLNHQISIDVAKLALTKSERKDVKEFAQNIIDSQTKEVEQMKTWQTDWFTAK